MAGRPRRPWSSALAAAGLVVALAACTAEEPAGSTAAGDRLVRRRPLPGLTSLDSFEHLFEHNRYAGHCKWFL